MPYEFTAEEKLSMIKSTFWSKATAMEKGEAKQYYKRFGMPDRPTLLEEIR